MVHCSYLPGISNVGLYKVQKARGVIIDDEFLQSSFNTTTHIFLHTCTLNKRKIHGIRNTIIEYEFMEFMCILQQSPSRLVHHNNNTLICSPDLLLTVLDISQELCHSLFII